MLFGELEFVKETLPFWKDLDAGQKRFMEVKLIERCYGQGQNIHNGEDCTGLLLVKNGQLRSFILSESGKEITLFRLFERDGRILSSSCDDGISHLIFIEAEKTVNSDYACRGVQAAHDANPAVKDFQTEIISARLSDDVGYGTSGVYEHG